MRKGPRVPFTRSRRLAVAVLLLLGGGADRASAQAWSTRAPLPTPLQEVAVAALDGRVYVVGGLSGISVSPAVQVYDPASDTWNTVAPLPIPLHHTTATAAAGKLYVVGGWSDLFVTPLARVFEYDSTADAWTEKASMPTARGSPAAAVIEGRIYVTGGDPGATDFAVYDPALDSWQVLPPMPTGRQHLGAAVVAGRFYAMGGRSSLGAGQDNVDAAEVFDPNTNQWSVLPPLPTARSGIAVAAARGRHVLVLGGEGNASSPDGTFPENEAFDAASGEWITLAPMPTPRHGIGAANVGDRIHVPGGAPSEGFSLTDVHEVYDASVELPPGGVSIPGLGAATLFVLAASLGSLGIALRARVRRCGRA